MTSFDTYKLFLALKQHFSTTNSYDYFKYHGKVKVSHDRFRTKPDRYFYEKLAKKYNQTELLGFFVSNLIHKPDVWIGDLCKQERFENVYLNWKRKKESLSYCFGEDVSLIRKGEDDFEKLFECNENEHPRLLDLYTEGTISLETLMGIDLVVDCFEHWNRILGVDIIWKDIHHLCIQYKPFLNYDYITKSFYKKILRKEFIENV